MKSIKILILHTGRYRIELYDDFCAGKDQGAGHVSDAGMINCFDCGSAGLMVTLSKLIFQDEALAYEMDRKTSSDRLATQAMQKMLRDPANQDPERQRLIQSRGANVMQQVAEGTRRGVREGMAKIALRKLIDD
jgi:hypothetical protein